MIWMKSFVRPPLARSTAWTRLRKPGMKRVVAAEDPLSDRNHHQLAVSAGDEGGSHRAVLRIRLSHANQLQGGLADLRGGRQRSLGQGQGALWARRGGTAIGESERIPNGFPGGRRLGQPLAQASGLGLHVGRERVELRRLDVARHRSRLLRLAGDAGGRGKPHAARRRAEEHRRESSARHAPMILPFADGGTERRRPSW